MSDIPQRLYQTKLTLLALVFVVAGVGLLMLSRSTHSYLLQVLPIADIGSGLFTTGLIGVALQYLDGKDADERASDRLRRILVEEAPAIRDAVLDGFAFSPETLADVTSPQLLERVVGNGLTMQLENPMLAAQVHHELLEQSMRPADRLSDSRLTVDLTAADRPDMLRATIRREYRCTPTHRVIRFASVSSREDFDTLLRDPETAEVWLAADADGLNAASQDVFTVAGVQFDGDPLEVRRSAKKGSQAFTCRLPIDFEDGEVLHHLSYEYSVLLPRANHQLHFDFARPTDGLTVEVTYDTTVPTVRVLDYLGTTADVRRATRPALTGGGDVTVSVDGWVLPRAGVVIVWR